MLREWADVPYLPILSMKPAEMRALEELPGVTKDALLPLIPLRPWVGAHRLRSVIDRIEQSYGSRPVAIALGGEEATREREVHRELERLRDPANGFRAWCDFQIDHPHYIPVAQLGIDRVNEPAQLERLAELGRGLIVQIEVPAFPRIADLAAMASRATNGGEGVCFLIDFGVATRDHLQVGLRFLGYFNEIIRIAPRSHVALSASSFPASFRGIPEHREIYERLLFNEVSPRVPNGKLVYSDRGSARAEALSGGSGVIPARIDYPQFNDWYFFRDEEAGADAYAAQARALIRHPVWNGDLRVWGTQMIERTARGDQSAIDNPLKSTAVRLNLHLQLQTFYGDNRLAQDTEEDWDG